MFKVPSLRNVAKTAPYFHDGSAKTLTEAVRMMAHHQLGEELSDDDIRSIVAWLGSLTGELPNDYVTPPQLCPPPATTASVGTKTMAKKILVVDDSPTIRQQVSAALSQAGFLPVEASDGVDALTKLDAATAMMICDVNMPRMGGLDLVDKMHGDARWTSVPVVMLTTESNSAQVDRAKKAGAKGWIIKPFKAELLVAAVHKLAR